MIVTETLNFPEIFEVCEHVCELFEGINWMNFECIAGQRNVFPVYCVFEYIGSQGGLFEFVLLDVVINDVPVTRNFYYHQLKACY